MQMPFQSVIFDLDGTLADTLADLADATNYALAAHGYPVHATEKYRYFVGNGARELIRRALPDGVQDFTSVYNTYIAYYGDHYLEKTCAYPGLPEAVQSLKQAGVKLGVVTNKPHYRAREIVEKFYPGLFDCIAGQQEGYLPKPDPALTLHVLEEIGGRQDSTAFVGDSNVDIHTARAAGLYPVGVLWGFRDRAELESSGARAIVSDAEELLQVLQGGQI